MDKDAKVKLHSGYTMPLLGLGSWQLQNALETVISALELGYRLIDTSSDYGSQPGIGKGINQSSIPRGEIFITTKVEEDDDAYKRSEQNLKELDVGYVDLMLIHRPPKNGAGKELWEGLIRAKQDGLTRDIGVSNYSIEQIEKLIKESGEMPVVNQIEWTPFGFSQEMLDYCKEKNIVIQAYSPLTRGERLDAETLMELATNYDKTPAQILLRWNIQTGSVPIPKASKEKHLKENIDVFDFEISERDLDRLNSLNEEYSSLGSLPYV